MKFRFILIALFLILSRTALFSESIDLASSIESVSLFRDGALVTRQGQSNIVAGKSILQIRDLPSNIDFNILQAEISEGQNVVVRNARIYLPNDREEPTTIKELREALLEITKESEKLSNDKSYQQSRISFAESMAESFTQSFGKISDGESLSIEQAKDTWSFLETTRQEAQRAIDEIETAIKTANEKREDAKKALDEAIKGYLSAQAVAEIEVESSAAQSITLQISYLARQARWQPKYELRAYPDKGSLKFGYFASVWQNTGEDWDDVEVTLHTNQASRNGNVPELQPLRIEKTDYNMYQSKSRKSIGGKSEEIFELDPFSKAADAAPPPMEAQISSSSASFQVLLPGQVRVPSSENATTLAITETSFDTEYWSESVPKIQLEAFLKGKTINTLELPILPGQALAFVDEKLSSKVSLEKTLPEQEFEISLGIDSAISIVRKEGAQENASSGFIDKTTTLKRAFFNEVSNYHAIDHKLVIVDHFPIAQNAKIEIRRLKPSSSEAEFEDAEKDLGIFKWTATIQPKESRTFETSYEVIYPRDWEIWPEL